MGDAIEVLLRNVDRIKSADCAGDSTVARLETEAFSATLRLFVQRNRIDQDEYRVFYDYLTDFSAKFPS